MQGTMSMLGKVALRILKINVIDHHYCHYHNNLYINKVSLTYNKLQAYVLAYLTHSINSTYNLGQFVFNNKLSLNNLLYICILTRLAFLCFIFNKPNL